MIIRKITPVLMVEEVEPCVRFWTERCGFAKTAEVPDGGKLGFAILQKGGLELMYQSYASVEKDLGARELSRELRKGPAVLYAEVDQLAEVVAAMENVPVAVPARTTFYGAKEIGVRDPGGHLVIFAEYAEP